jgi:hypothetical protein
MNKFTADDARKLYMENSVEGKVETLLLSIKTAASEGKRSINTGYQHKEDMDFWNNGGYGKTAKWKEAIKILTDLGFDACFYYSEGQLVDMYTIVKW